MDKIREAVSDMARCEECIHSRVCVIRGFPSAFENTHWEKEPCDHFKSADVAPRAEWISVEERLPEEGKNVLCFENGKFYIAFFEKYEEGAWWDWVAYDRDDTWNEVCPSHWMPLPEPPKGE